MSKGGYTLLGWIVWQVGRRVARRKLAENRAKVGATAVALVIVAGILAARSGGGEE
ncbi:MAG TPA: hypothetical protein VK387_05290 [Thermoleophilaceae bacterium]|nr:hypothetical protein [Thermoleophilaceae bacterium]